MRVVERPSPNQDARGVGVDMLVLHYTGMANAEAALARLCDPAAKVSAHYAIDEDGTVYAMVPEVRRAWHAGVSCWAGARDINARSIGIELVNPGHEFGYRAFGEAQIVALIALCREILARHAIPRLAGAGVTAMSRPCASKTLGELFPWEHLAEAGIGLWPRRGGDDDPGESAVAGLLARYGYDPEASPEKVVTAFQRHFRPSRVDGMADGETRGVLSGLVALYDGEKRETRMKTMGLLAA